ELGNEELAFQFRHSLRESRLNVGHGAVVDERSDFFHEEGEQQPSRQVADCFRHVLFKVAFDGSDGVLACFGRDLYHWSLLLIGSLPSEAISTQQSAVRIVSAGKIRSG